MAVIYRITNMANGKYYIGSAESFARREWQHKYDLRKGIHKNPRLQAAWVKYGEEMFVFEVLEEVPEGASTFDWENKYLYAHVGLPECYNVNTDAIGMRTGIPHREETKALMSRKVQAAVAEGRAGKFIPSEETRRKMSEALKGNQCAKGHIRSEEHRRRLSEANKGNQNWLGKRHSEESKLKMSKPILEVTTNKEFPSLTAVLEHYNMSMPTLRRALVSGLPISKGRYTGLQFQYAPAKKAVFPGQPGEQTARADDMQTAP
jgi:group I intron endonuclease